jgi:uncharacterized membrane protein
MGMSDTGAAGEFLPTMGPVQVLVIEFEAPNFTGEILPELRRLQDAGIVNLVDLLVVLKSEDGDLSVAELSGLTEEERVGFGAIAGALIGWGTAGEAGVEEGAIAGALAMADGGFTEDQVWAIEDAIPPGSAAAVAILEHRWCIPFRDAVIRAGGVSLADEWVHPMDLVAAGIRLTEAS